MSRTTSSTLEFAWPASRLCGPKSPKCIRTNSNPIAVPYAATTKARTNRPLRRPSGKARKTCKNSTGATRSMACPTVCGTSLVDHTSVEAKLTKPAAIINGPKRLVGRRRQAKSPQSTYESVRRAASTAITRGSPNSTPTPSPATASVNETAAAAHPTIAIAHETDALAAAEAAPRSKLAAIAKAAMVIPLPCRRPDGTSQARPPSIHGGGRKEASTREHTPASPQRPLARTVAPARRRGRPGCGRRCSSAPASGARSRSLAGDAARGLVRDARRRSGGVGPLADGVTVVAAQVLYARDREWAVTADDVLRRRRTLALTRRDSDAVRARVEALLAS